ncbi:glycyl-tRNA synthetase subunit beta [Candidatus Termititenax persephonae]|uniref:Glycine--tRNA ligase beta subunit n=1 Tax=Candidatus Termititenax persephonae TaxID=2218525 RepID=A0A388TF81_9BACT|nr:glycyl-tRNA synthetase subunit beta [Candidatus Termititenax persephonae]
MADFLLEIGVEEIPARFMPGMLDSFDKAFRKFLSDNVLPFDKLSVYGTDRRLAVLVNGLAERQADRRLELKGPPLKSAYADGKLTQAGAGWLKKNKLTEQDAEKKDFGGTKYLFAMQEKKGRAVADILREFLSGALYAAVYLPLAMRWGDLTLEFIRPLHWFVALLDDAVVDFEYAGIRSGRYSRGHRFFASQPLEIKTPQEYVAVLAANKVYVQQQARQEKITTAVRSLSEEKGLTAVWDERILQEVTFINECPEAVLAEIAEKYLSVPQECLITTMQKNQKYFPLLDKQGKLTKYFILISNNVNEKSLANIISGNVKVVTARLEDAKFFYEEDLQTPLETMLAGLKKVTYQEKIGTIYQKVERLVKIAEWLADKLQFSAEQQRLVSRAAWLAKADLNSKMVYEFPELQGVMGKYYAQAAGEAPEVAQALLEHWRPRYAGEDITQVAPISALVAIADKTDSLASCFAAGLIPTSSADPYALRRAAQGIVALIQALRLDIDLPSLLKFALDLLKGSEELQAEILQFFKSRIKSVLQEMHYSYDVIDAVLAVPQEDILRYSALAEAVQQSKADKKFIETAVRVNNIAGQYNGDFTEKYLSAPEEKELWRSCQAAERAEDIFAALRSLVAPTEIFFAKILVMDEDENIKNARLGLLKKIDALFKKTADYTKIVL